MRFVYLFFSILVLASCSSKKTTQRPPIQHQSNSKDHTTSTETSIQKDSIVRQVETATHTNNQTTNDTDVVIEQPINYIFNTYNVALLLPFNTDNFYEKDSLGNTQKTIHENNKVGLWLYEGIKMAVEEYSNANIPVNFFVFDTYKSEQKINEILRDKDIQEAHVIIGPVYNNLMKTVNDWALKNDKIVFSPLSASDNFAANNSNFFQVRPSFYHHALNGLKHLQAEGIQEIILLHKNTVSELQNAQKVYEANQALNYHFKIRQMVCTSNTLLSPADGTVFENLLINNNTAILIPSVEEQFVTSIYSELLKYKPKINCVLGNAYWIGFNNWNEKFSNIPTYITSPYYVDYKSDTINTFIQNNVRTYGDMPTEYLYLGYDLAKMIINNLLYKGVDFNNLSFEGLSTNFNFGNIEKNNFIIKKENSFLHVLKIEKESLVKIK